MTSEAERTSLVVERQARAKVPRTPLGGRLAYHYGVRVADDATQAEGFR